MDGIYKHSEQLKFKDEARLNPISDLSIGFYNLDINTSLLTFQVTKQGSPMLLSENHVTAYCILRSSDNKNVSRVLELEITDGMNGILQLQIPNEFLKAVSKPDSIQSVVGQAYLSVNGKEDTVVFSEFNFRVKDAMINQISSKVKVEYIRMFDDLKNEIEDRVNYIEEQIEHGEDYVALMKQTVSSGVKEINSLVDKSKSDINQTVNVYRQDVEDTKTFAISQINSEVDLMNNSISKAKEDIDKSIEQYKSDIKQSRNDVINITTQSQSSIESQVNQGKQDINNLKDESLNSIGDAKDDALDSIQNSTDWQKYKLINDDGVRKWLGVLNAPVENLKTGFYECTIPADAGTVNAPKDIHGSAYLAEINITESLNGRKQIILLQNYTKDVWLKTIHTDGVDRGWVLLNRDYEKDLNWQKYKFTEDDGTIKYISKGSITDVKTLPPGFYETVSNDDASSQDIPLDNSYVQIKVWEANEGRKEIELTSTYNNKKYFRLLHTNGDRDSGWIEVGPTQEDTGWIPLQLLNGAQSNTEYSDSLGNGFKCSYRTVVNGSLVTNYLRINGRNIQTDTVIAKIPEKMVKHAQTFIPRTPINRPMGYIILYTNGEVKFFVNSGTGTSSWDSSAYMYGEFSWTN